MADLELTLALHDYDHTRDLVTGRVGAEGISLRVIQLTPPEINARFSRHREWHVSEFGMGKYIALRAGGDDSITAIPVFPARAFRQSAIYVRSDSELQRAEDLAGRRVGIPEWAQTAVVYARGYLAEDRGVDLASIDWHQAGVSQAGRVEKVKVTPPAGVSITPHPESTLEELLFAGDVDALITAQPPDAFRDGDPRIRRLFANPRDVEADYYRRTGIFPIMHTVAIRRDVYDAHPWVAINLVRAFTEAKRRSYERMTDAMGGRYPLPWIDAAFADACATFGADPYPYGIEANRTTLEAVLRFAHQQGVAAKHLAAEDLFAPTTHASIPL